MSASVVADVATHVVHGHIVIAAPRERVFAALTDPLQLASWWGSDDAYRTFDWQVDLRPGGAWSCQAEGKNGRSTVRGSYRVIDPPAALELTWEPAWEGFHTTTIRYELEVVPEGTRLRIRHWGFATPEACSGHADGWTRVFGWLEAGLDEGALAARLGALEPVAPHPRAQALVLPDGRAAPRSLRLWAAYDALLPSPYPERDEARRLADDEGRLRVAPMSEVMRWVALESVREELAEDEETLGYLDALARTLADAHPGFGVLLEPQDTPDRILWLGPDGKAIVLEYHRDALTVRSTFAAYALATLDG